MRSFLVLALATLAIAGPAFAGGGTCLPTCEVKSHLLAFVPPLTALERGSTVTWTSMDVPHTATDYSGGFGADPCFETTFTRTVPGAAHFTILGGALFAVSEVGGGELVECVNATPLADGSFSIYYLCAFHNRMDGTLIVR